MTATPARNRPNFLFICTDQMRADHLGCAGNPVIQTPHLDALARSGLHLPRSYVNCPLCQPSRATMLTGLTPRGHRVRTNGIPLDQSFPTVPGALAEAGYHTASIGKIHASNYGVGGNSTHTLAAPYHYEQSQLWASGQVNGVPTPYYGHQHVELTIGHATWMQGDYIRWLQREHPEQYQKFSTTKPTPSPLGAEQCGTYQLAEEYHHTAWVADRTINWLAQRSAAQPFYLWCSFPDPHHAFVTPSPWDRMYRPEDVPGPTLRAGELAELAPHFQRIHDRDMPLSGRFKATKMSDAHRREIIAYTYGMVSLLDKHVGRILAALDEQGLADNTVVVFLADHGDMLGDHHLMNKGPFHFEGLLRVPMIWRLPEHVRGELPAGQTSPALMSLLDLPPTVLDLAGVPIPAGPTGREAPQEPPAWPGRSLTPVLRGSASDVQDSVLVENDEDYLGLRLRTLITPRHKLTTYTGHRGPEPYGELFDLEQDPGELHNLWARPEHRPLRLELTAQLHHRLTETDIALPRRLAHA